MSQPEFPKEGTGGGPSGNSNTWIIIAAVVAVLAICGLCVCGGVGIWYLRLVPAEPTRIEPDPARAAPDWESPADESDSD